MAVPAAHARTGIRFLGVGAVNTIAGLLVIYAGKWAGLGDVAANALGYAVGLLISFGLNRQWTFADRGRPAPAFVRFVLVTCVAYALNLVTVLVLIRSAGVNGYLAQALGVVPYTLASYLGCRYIVFPRQAA